MDPERERIQADLRGLIDGEARCDDLTLQLYASDASIYEIRPLAVVRPQGVKDVSACLQYAHENGIPVHARGAGTGLAGESLGRGIVIDFSFGMRRILETSAETVRVQPGVVLSQLNRHLADRGRMFAPDPATRSVSTIGSALALDASGSHWLRYGSARRYVKSMQVVLADGVVLEVGQHSVSSALVAGGRDGQAADAGPFADTMHPPQFADKNPIARNEAAVGSAALVAGGRDGQDPAQRLQHLVSELSNLILDRQEIIAEHRPKSLVNRCGYHLYDVLSEGRLDLARLLVGSEGTLALITEATLKTTATPRHRGVALLFFDRLEGAAHGALEAAAMDVCACDLMDRRLLTIARDVDVRYDLLIPRQAEAMLLIEVEGHTQTDAREKLQNVVHRLHRRRRVAFDARSALDSEEQDLFWRLARRVIPTLYRLRGSTRPLPFIEDIAVPPAVLPDFLVRMQNVLKTHQVTASLFSHAGHGQLHIRPFLDLGDPEHVKKMEAVASDMYQEVLHVGGTISGEHGAGLSRTPFMARQFGPLYNVFRDVKSLFDPNHILNPGKVLADSSSAIHQQLRPVVPESEQDQPWPLAVQGASNGTEPRQVEPPSMEPRDNGSPPDPAPAPLELQLQWAPHEFAFAVRNCNGCGRCRTQSSPERMCPIFRLAPAEEASPRAKANLMRAVLTGRLNPEHLAGDDLKSLADLCVNCHQCRLECPAGVDIPKLMVEAKAQYAAVNGLSVSDWCMAHLDLAAKWGARARPLVNWSLGNRVMRWLMDKTLGIAQGRKLPRLAARNFLRRAHRRRLTRPTRGGGRKVFYFVDLYANYFDVQLAEAHVAILERNGVTVYVSPAQLPSAMASVSLGAIDNAKRIASKNLPILAEAVRQGYHIVATEPAAALCLTHEYPNLFDDDDARLVAENTSEACAYLWRMHQTGKLELDLRPLNTTLGYHLPCLQRALGQGSPGENLLRLIPGLSVQRIERGCSGMAGTYGLKSQNYRSSLRAGWGLITALRDPAIHGGATECSTCKIQMEQGVTKPTLHPLKLLALAYGLMPEIAAKLNTRGEEYILT